MYFVGVVSPCQSKIQCVINSIVAVDILEYNGLETPITARSAYLVIP